jgi:hypothetical protein
MSERAALNLLCSISDRFTALCLYMTIACEWRVVMGPETHEECTTNAQQSGSLRSACSTARSLHNGHACKLQPDPRSLVGSRDPGPALQRAVCRGPSHSPAGYKLPVIPINLRRKLLLTE